MMDKKLLKNAETAKLQLLAEARTLGMAVICSHAQTGPRHDNTAAPAADISNSMSDGTATNSADRYGFPETAHAPFIRKDGDFFIYSSTLSAHARALLKRQPAQFFLIADESASQNIWARIRLKFTARINEIGRGSKDSDDILDLLRDRHGPVVDLIRNFSDFHLFRITPQTGVLVTGFAAAFTVSGPDFKITGQLRQG